MNTYLISIMGSLGMSMISSVAISPDDCAATIARADFVELEWERPLPAFREIIGSSSPVTWSGANVTWFLLYMCCKRNEGKLKLL